jgi:plasmid replication initiation protein
MFKPELRIADRRLDETIDKILSEMDGVTADSDEYARMREQLTKLYETKATFGRKPVSMDVLLTALANLAGVVIIVNHEHVNVITSKAMSFIPKIR